MNFDMGECGVAKKPSCVFLSVFLVLLLGAQVSAATNGLSLESVVELALKESVDFRIAELEWEQAQLAHKKALADNLLTQSAYNHRAAELSLMKGEAAYKKALANAMITAVRRFGDVELANLDLRIKELQLRRSTKAEELTLRKAATQNASELDVLEAKVALAKSQFDYEKAQDTLAEKRQAFAILVGSDEHLPDGKLYFAPFDLQLPDMLAQVLESNPNIQEAQDNVELARLDLERLLLDETAELVVKEARNKLALARLRLEQTEGTITQELLAAYNGANNALRSYEASNNNHELQRRQYAVVEGQVAAGLKTEDDLAKARIALWEAERAVYDALNNYIIACLQLYEVNGADVQASLKALMKGTND